MLLLTLDFSTDVPPPVITIVITIIFVDFVHFFPVGYLVVEYYSIQAFLAALVYQPCVMKCVLLRNI